LDFHASHDGKSLIPDWQSRVSEDYDGRGRQSVPSDKNTEKVAVPRFTFEFAYVWSRLTRDEKALCFQVYVDFDYTNENLSSNVADSINDLQKSTHDMCASNIGADDRLAFVLWQKISEFNSGTMLPQTQPSPAVRAMAQRLRQLSSQLQTDINSLADQVQANQVTETAAVNERLSMISRRFIQAQSV
jgi:hypothetical protein